MNEYAVERLLDALQSLTLEVQLFREAYVAHNSLRLERIDEPNCSEKPNNCEDEPQTFDKPTKCLGCLYSDLDKAFHPCASCENFSKYIGEVSGKTEPQTCDDCDQVGRCDRGRAVDCPLTERSE